MRDRNAEFTRRHMSREEVKTELQHAEEEIGRVIRTLGDAALETPFPGDLHGMQMPTRRLFLALEAHTAFHLAQAGYLRRIVTGNPISSDPIPTEPLSDVQGKSK